MRYFARLADDLPPVMLSRLDLDTPGRITEEIWAGGQWRPTKEIVKGLVTGSNDYDEVSDAFARKAFPEAFTETKGGPGSGNHGHAGRPGMVGGSAPDGLSSVSEVFGIQDLPQDKVIAYVAEHGKSFGVGQSLPDDMKRMAPNECYKNSTNLMWEHSSLTYVEGLAWEKGKPDLAILHGWNTDANGSVIDVTVEHPERWEYFGVEYDRKTYMAHITKTMMYGVLGGDSKSAKKVLAQGGLTKGPK